VVGHPKVAEAVRQRAQGLPAKETPAAMETPEEGAEKIPAAALATQHSEEPDIILLFLGEGQHLLWLSVAQAQVQMYFLPLILVVGHV
jgi:hypothetical protein